MVISIMDPYQGYKCTLFILPWSMEQGLFRGQNSNFIARGVVGALNLRFDQAKASLLLKMAITTIAILYPAIWLHIKFYPDVKNIIPHIMVCLDMIIKSISTFFYPVKF